MNARELIEFITNPYNPSVNPWSFVQKPGMGPMGFDPNNRPGARRTVQGDVPPQKNTPANVDIRYIKRSED